MQPSPAEMMLPLLSTRGTSLRIVTGAARKRVANANDASRGVRMAVCTSLRIVTGRRVQKGGER